MNIWLECLFAVDCVLPIKLRNKLVLVHSILPGSGSLCDAYLSYFELELSI